MVSPSTETGDMAGSAAEHGGAHEATGHGGAHHATAHGLHPHGLHPHGVGHPHAAAHGAASHGAAGEAAAGSGAEEGAQPPKSVAMSMEIGADPDDLHDEIPPRFMAGALNDPVEARRRWQLTKKWRRSEKIDGILDEAHRVFAICKKVYPHYLHKTDRLGRYVYIERPGRCDIKRFWDRGMSMDELVRHYVYLSEATWRLVDKRDDAVLVTIFDVEGSTMRDLYGNALTLFSKCSEVIQLHYPERSGRILIINAPWWFKAAWALLSPFIDARTKKKVSVFGSNYKKELHKEIAPENLPVEFGGTDECELGFSPAELMIWENVIKANTKAGVETEDMRSVYDWQNEHVHKKAKEPKSHLAAEEPPSSEPSSCSSPPPQSDCAEEESSAADRTNVDKAADADAQG